MIVVPTGSMMPPGTAVRITKGGSRNNNQSAYSRDDSRTTIARPTHRIIDLDTFNYVNVITKNINKIDLILSATRHHRATRDETN